MRENPGMTESRSPVSLFSGTTAWARSLETPLRQFLRTETGSAAVLLFATVAALVWVNIDSSSYQTVWATRLSVSVGGSSVSQDLHDSATTEIYTLSLHDALPI